MGPGTELQLTIDDRAVPHDEVLAAVEVLEAEQVLTRALAREETAGEVGEGLPLEPENLYAAGERIALRAASASTRRQYASIYRAFGDWIRSELDRPPTGEDLHGDAIAAYARHLDTQGGRGGRPAALATRRVYLSVQPGGWDPEDVLALVAADTDDSLDRVIDREQHDERAADLAALKLAERHALALKAIGYSYAPASSCPGLANCSNDPTSISRGQPPP